MQVSNPRPGFCLQPSLPSLGLGPETPLLPASVSPAEDSGRFNFTALVLLHTATTPDFTAAREREPRSSYPKGKGQ